MTHHIDPDKTTVSHWETVDGYQVTFPTTTGEGHCEVAVQIGEAGGRWYVRTTDDDGGSDECDDTAYPTRESAVAAAEAFAAEVAAA